MVVTNRIGAQRFWVIGLALAIAAPGTLGACGSSDDVTLRPSAGKFVRLLEGFEARYDAANSPSELGDRSALVVVGRITKIDDGPIYGERGKPGSAETLSVHVKVSDVKKGTLPPESDNQIYFQLYATLSRPASAYNRVAPRDVDVLLYLVPAPLKATPNEPIDGPGRGRPDGQPLWQLTTPQGFLLSSGDDVIEVTEFRRYEGVSLESFFPEKERFPDNPNNPPEDAAH